MLWKSKQNCSDKVLEGFLNTIRTNIGKLDIVIEVINQRLCLMTEIWNLSNTDRRNVWNLHSKYERGMTNHLRSQRKHKEKLCIEWRREMNESRKL